MASETTEDRYLYAKAPKINVRDFKRERQIPSPNETQLMQWLAIETLEVREAPANESQPATAISN